MDTVFFDSRTRSRGRIALAVATATFFLLCHGLLGASHALGAVALPAGIPSDGAHQTHQMQMNGHGAPASHNPDGTTPHEGGPALAYASVIFASALGALMLFSLARTRILFGFVTSRSGRGDFVFRKGLIPCRGPTLTALQVFRL